MARVHADRVMELTTTTGSGDITLAAAVIGFQRFSDVCAIGDTFDYSIFAVDGAGAPTGDWETGQGTYSAANTLTRTTMHESSTGSTVNFGSGLKYVILSHNAASVASGGGGSGGSVSVDRVINASAVSEVVIDALDFINYDYEVRIELRCGERFGNCDMRIQTGDSSGTIWNTNTMWQQQSGAVSSSTYDGQARVGYSGTVQADEPIVSTVELRTTSDRKTMSGRYYFGNYESYGVIAQNTTTVIAGVRLMFSDGDWTGKIVVYKYAKA